LGSASKFHLNSYIERKSLVLTTKNHLKKIREGGKYELGSGGRTVRRSLCRRKENMEFKRYNNREDGRMSNHLYIHIHRITINISERRKKPKHPPDMSR
jgi:hypothetical protein